VDASRYDRPIVGAVERGSPAEAAGIRYRVNRRNPSLLEDMIFFDDETTEKSTEPKDAALPRTRKIVRRSASTRDNPAFTEPVAAPAEAAPPGAPSAEGARPEAGAETLA